MNVYEERGRGEEEVELKEKKITVEGWGRWKEEAEGWNSEKVSYIHA